MRVGFAGLGHMGLPMAIRLDGHGFPLTVWNRNASRAAPLADRGIRLAGTAWSSWTPRCPVAPCWPSRAR